MTRRLEFVWPDELVERVDRARGDVPRTKFVQRALESALANLADVGESKAGGRGGSPAPSRTSEAKMDELEAKMDELAGPVVSPGVRGPKPGPPSIASTWRR